MSRSAVPALRGHEVVLLDGFSITALVITSLAWLLIAAALTLELTGRLAVRQRHPGQTRFFRIQMLALLAVVTTGLANEIANDLPWPYAARTGLAVLALVVAIIAIAIWIATALANRPAAR